ncbi:class I SAM-dependent methyltransferase [Streptomyces poonensis]|uniref:Methyltransferase n=1 Tax=Streptomyces poonensis TaxID=68255 RepID=A0A918UPJ9_9ACTN|nr:class I SAM-dependent methyltransferase [Streptomyces poonensis]GGZ24909.1 methyltransferase [Streptomyces poonensis]GLJ93579.1 methyltransferase [Streptomyces poonensis]
MSPDRCLLCAAPAPETVLDLRPTPPANALAPTADEARRAATFPLRLVRCAACTHVQLADLVDRDLLFRDYKYATGTAPGLVRHYGTLARTLIDRHRLPAGATVVEIGSNDGTLLRGFAAAGLRVLGVDPAADLARHAEENGVPTLATHFDDSVAEKILAERGPADLVLANNVLAHVGDLGSTLRGIRRLLAPTGAHAVVEAAHLLPMATAGMYEFIYHEHMSYFSLHALRTAAERHDLAVTDVEEIPTQGGSIRCWLRPAGAVRPADVSPAVAELLRREEAAGVTDGSLLHDFAARTRRVNTGLHDVVHGLRARGRRLSGYGASARAVTLMSQAGIDDAIDRIVDDNPRKHGLHVPGSGIPIAPPTALDRTDTDYCVLFAWNFRDDIRAGLTDYVRAGGMFVVPFPALTVE